MRADQFSLTRTAPAPLATADSATHLQWLTLDAAARLAIRNHLPLAKCAHFGQHRTAHALYDAVDARYSSPATAALGRLLLPYLFPELSAFATVEDLVSHLRASDARYHATVPAKFLDRNQPPMFITLYFIDTRLSDSLRSVRDHFLSLDPTSLTVDQLEQHLLVAETTVVAVDVPGAEDIGAASASAKRRSGKAKGSRGGGGDSGSGGGGSSGGSGGSGGGGSGGSGGGSGGVGGGGGGSGGSGGSGGGGTGGGRTGARRGGSGGGQRQQQQQRRSETQSTHAEGDCYRCVPPDLGIAAATLGASESTIPGTVPAEALHNSRWTHGALAVFFVTAPLSLLSLHLSRYDWLTPQGAQSLPVPPLSSRVRRSGSTPLLVSPPVAPDPAVAPRPGSTLPAAPLWHALPSPYLWSSQRAAPHSSLPPTTAPLQTLHMDVWGPACVTGQGRERYFLLVVDDYSRYTTVFPLRSKGQVIDVLIPWIRTVRLKLRERFSVDLLVLHLHSDRGGEFSSNLVREFCRGEGILQLFMLPDSPQKNGIAERRIGLVMEVSCTSMIHAAAPHFLWPFGVQYAAHQLNLWLRVSLPETSPTLRWTGEVGDASVFRMDITTAFLNGIIQEELYMLQPERLDDGSGKVCRLKKAIYGLKQAPRAWYHKLEETLLAGGFKKSECDHSLFLLQEKEQFLMLLVYVDYILLFSESAAMIERVEEMLEMHFKCSKMGDVKYYIGMHVERDLDKGVLRLHQRKYCEGLAEKYGLQDGGKPATPPTSGFTVEPCADEEAVGESDRKLFHSMVGALNYAANHTRPDIAFATSRIDSVVSRPSHEQLEAAKRLVRYVSATASVGLEYNAVRQRQQRGAADLGKGEMLLTCYTDASFNSVKADGTSIGGYLCLFGGGAVSWRNKKQNEVGLSSCETEYMALHHGVKEVVWLRRLLEEIGVFYNTFEPAAVSALIAVLLGFAAPCRLDYATALVAESECASPPSVKSECALGTDVLEERKEDFVCLAATSPRLLPCCLPLWETRMHQTSRPRALTQRRLRGVDYFQNFSPTPKMTTLQVLLHVAAQRDYDLHSLDLSTTFLQGSLHEEIWLRHPPGFTGSFPTGTQWSLQRSPPGASQVAQHTEDYTCCSWSHMVHQVLQRFGFEFSSPQPTPLSTGHSLSAPPSDESVEPSGPYRELVGCLMYLMTCTRPDLAYPLSLLARYMALGRHRKVHWDAAKRVLRYLCSTSGIGLVLGGRVPVVLTGHADASWVEDSAMQRSSQGYNSSLGSGSVSWRSTRSSSVLSSSCEAEIYAGAMAG
ncbi:unnamed protein product [Closterium sp. NIES-54]